MKTYTILAAAMVVAGAHGQAVRATGSGGYGPDSSYNRLYNRKNEVMFTGKVTGKLYNSPNKGMEQGMTLLVKTTKYGTQTVELGPRWFVAQQVAKVNLGDQVKVIGSKARLNGNNVVIAKQVVNPKKAVLAVRDIDGNPYWTAYRKGTIAQIPDNAISGTILSSATVNYNNTPTISYLVQTPNGNVNVMTAPAWYWNHQDYTLPVGASLQFVGASAPNVRILGAPATYQIAPYTYVADSIYTGGNTIVLRNGGVPIWNGW